MLTSSLARPFEAVVRRNRLLSVSTSRKGVWWDIDAVYEYNIHGPLARLQLGQDKVQGVDYAYTLQGWLKSINASTARHDLDPGIDGDNYAANPHRFHGRDVYGYSLHYYGFAGEVEIDYTPINSDHVIDVYTQSIKPSAGGGKYHLYNGNIGATFVRLPKPGKENWMDNSLLKGYNYDQLNRLSQMKTVRSISGSTDNFVVNNAVASGDAFTRDYQTNYSYDANGNILSLVRNGYSYGSNPLAMDSLSYGYMQDVTGDTNLINNQLRYIDEFQTAQSNYGTDYEMFPGSYSQGSSTAGDPYEYDEIGNLVMDQTAEIDEIGWYANGKIKSISRSSSSTQPDLIFRYDALGNRIAKIVKPKTGSGALKSAEFWTVTHYVRDAQGNIMASYKESFDEITSGSTYESHLEVQEFPIYGSDRLGIAGSEAVQDLSFAASASTTGWAGSEATPNYTFGPGNSVEVQGQSGVVTVLNNSGSITMTAIGEDVILQGLITFSYGGDTLSGVENAHLLVAGETGEFTFNNGSATVDLEFTGQVLMTAHDYDLELEGPAVLVTNVLDLDTTRFEERKLDLKQYELKNHLGNVLTTISDRKTGMVDVTSSTLLSEEYSEESAWTTESRDIETSTGEEGLTVIVGEVEEEYISNAISISTASNCYYEICLDLGASEVEVVSLAVMDGSTELYSVDLDAHSQTCISNLYLPNNFTLTLTATGPGTYEINNLIVKSHCSSFKYYVANVQSAQDYYPFGMVMPGRSYQGSDGYRYGFQGQEKDDEIKGDGNSVNYKYRMHDPRIGRFFAVDPLTREYPWNSPYAFSENRVIDGVELEGLEYVTVHHYNDGSVEFQEFYTMSDEEIIDRGGTVANFYHAASFGPEGRGILHLYYDKEGEVLKDRTYLEAGQTSISKRNAHHGLYSGPGAISMDETRDLSIKTDYLFQFQPIDYADAIAKRHDEDYAAIYKEVGYKGGFKENVKTLQADLDMVKRIDNLLSLKTVTGIDDPYSKRISLETVEALVGQRLLISSLATYKQWKIDNNREDQDYSDNAAAFALEYPAAAAAVGAIPKESEDGSN